MHTQTFLPFPCRNILDITKIICGIKEFSHNVEFLFVYVTKIYIYFSKSKKVKMSLFFLYYIVYFIYNVTKQYLVCKSDKTLWDTPCLATSQAESGLKRTATTALSQLITQHLPLQWVPSMLSETRPLPCETGQALTLCLESPARGIKHFSAAMWRGIRIPNSQAWPSQPGNVCFHWNHWLQVGTAGSQETQGKHRGVTGGHS